MTLRATTAGDVVGFIDRFGARSLERYPVCRAPGGNLRWRAPQPPDSWTGTREALRPADMCPQMKSLLSGDAGEPDSDIAGVEDCLYLNVWAPTNASNLPVMFWIHGGGNSIGHGGPYNGAPWPQRGCRGGDDQLSPGPVGWFATLNSAAAIRSTTPATTARWTLSRALEWTRDNIRAFGGNPDNVTVFGESAGASTRWR